MENGEAEFNEFTEDDVLEGTLDPTIKPSEELDDVPTTIELGEADQVDEEAEKLAAAVKADEEQEAQLLELAAEYTKEATAQHAMQEELCRITRVVREGDEALEKKRNVLVKRAALSQQKPSRTVEVEIDGTRFRVEIARLGVKVEEVPF